MPPKSEGNKSNVILHMGIYKPRRQLRGLVSDHLQYVIKSVHERESVVKNIQKSDHVVYGFTHTSKR